MLRYCGQCGEASVEGDRFCTACGHVLRLAVETAAKREPAAGDGSAEIRNAVHLLAAGQSQEAVTALEGIVARSPTWGVARAYLGIGYLRLAQVADARAELEEAVRLAPESFICRTKYAEFLARLGFYDQALNQLDEALKLGAPDGESRLAAMELRQFCKDKAKGLFYRRTAYPKLRLGRLAGRRQAFRRQPITNQEG